MIAHRDTSFLVSLRNDEETDPILAFRGNPKLAGCNRAELG